MACNTPEENALELMQDEEHAATYCANCDNDAVVVLTIADSARLQPRTLALCAICKEAFDWGIAEAANDIDENDL